MKENTTIYSINGMSAKLDTDYLHNNGIYFCAIDSAGKNIYLAKEFIDSPTYVQRFILMHEVGHMICKSNDGIRLFINEVNADRYSANKVGIDNAIKALQYMLDYLCKANWTAIADIPSRMVELGADMSKWSFTLPNGVVATEPILRQLLK